MELVRFKTHAPTVFAAGMGRIPFLSKFFAKRKLGKAGKFLDRVDVQVKKANTVIDEAERSVKTCCPDSIAMNNSVSALRDRLGKSCKTGRGGGSSVDDDEIDVPDTSEEVKKDHAECRREAGARTNVGPKHKPKWVACMRQRGYAVTTWIPASRIEEIPAKS